MGALQYVCVPNYAALLMRQTYPMLSQEGGLMEVAEEWLGPTDAIWHASVLSWEFPSGATLTFGHTERDAQRFKWQSSRFDYVGFDEATHWKTDKVYRYLFSRLRQPAEGAPLQACPHCKLTLADLPLRMRSGTNPGGPGHKWYKARIIEPWRQWKRGEGPKPEIPFIASALSDNPSLNAETYRANLAKLDPVERARLEHGDWDVAEGGGFLKPEWFPVSQAVPAESAQWCRYWDLAATTEDEDDDPDWTAGALVAHDGAWWIRDIIRGRWTPGATDQRIIDATLVDLERFGRRNYQVGLEQEPGSSGKRSAAELKAKILAACGAVTVTANTATGSKVDRARPVASVAEAEPHVRLAPGEWVSAFHDEVTDFPTGAHDDQVDAISGAFELLSPTGKRKVRFH